MVALLRQFLEICLLRQGPQDLPYAPALSRGLVAALLAVQYLGARQGGFEFATAALRLLVSVALLVGVTRVLLQWRGLANRAEQTIAAFAGTGLGFSLLVLPIALLLEPATPDLRPEPGQFGLALLALALFVWKLRIDAHIWRQALGLRTGALALAVALMLLEVLLIALLTPTPAA